MVEGSKEKDSVKSRCSRQGVFCKKGALKSFAIYTGKCLLWSLVFIKLQVFSEQHYPQNLLRYKFFTVNCCKILRQFLKNTTWRLLLKEYWISLKFWGSFYVLPRICCCQIQASEVINWCKCRILYAIFTCLTSGVWWIPQSIGRF